MRLLLLLVLAHLATAADIVITQAWSRATSASMPNGAVFATIANIGTVDDRLMSVTTTAAERVELHAVITEGSKKRMVPVDGGISVTAKGTTMLKPGSYHIMLFGLKQPLVAGQTIDLTLTFEHAGALALTATIAEAAAMTSPEAAADDASCCQPK